VGNGIIDGAAGGRRRKMVELGIVEIRQIQEKREY